MKYFRLVSAALFVLAAASCSRPQPPVMIAPDGWTEIKAADQLSLYAPPGTVFRSEQGTDSFVGRFVGKGFVVTFDYGRYSNTLSAEASDPDYRTEHFGVGGQLAVFVVGPSRGQESCAPSKTIAALYVHGRAPSNLMALACLDDAAQVPTARSMFRTIRFDR